MDELLKRAFEMDEPERSEYILNARGKSSMTMLPIIAMGAMMNPGHRPGPPYQDPYGPQPRRKLSQSERERNRLRRQRARRARKKNR